MDTLQWRFSRSSWCQETAFHPGIVLLLMIPDSIQRRWVKKVVSLISSCDCSDASADLLHQLSLISIIIIIIKGEIKCCKLQSQML